MHPSTMSIFTGIRVSLYFSVFFLLLITIGLGGCNTEQSKQNGPGQAPAGATPTTSPSPVPSPSKAPGDTVVVIKDGSVDLYFDETTRWLPTASGPYELRNDKLKDVRITPTGGSRTTYPITNPNTTITINAGGTTHDITVVGNATTTPNTIQLKFGKNEYKECSKPGRKHCNDTNHIKEVKIGSAAPVDCQNKQCEVVICTQTSSDPRCQ